MKLKSDVMVDVQSEKMDEKLSSPTESNGKWIGEEFSFSDQSLSSSVLACMDTLRQAGHLCDCVLRVGNKSAEFPAHQAVLAAASPYFMAMFEQDPRTAEVRKCYTIKDVSASATRVLLDYCYTGILKVKLHSLRDVYKAAQKLKFYRVVTACSDYILEALNSSNCLELRTFTADNENLVSRIDDFIQSNLSSVMSSKAFLSLPQISFKLIGYHRGDNSEPNSSTVAKLIADWLLSSSARIQDGDSVLEVEGGSSSGSSHTDFPVLTEHENVLWLDDDNHIQDPSLAAETISQADVVQDYVKACRKFTKKGPVAQTSSAESQNGDQTKSLEVIAHDKLNDGTYSVIVRVKQTVYHMIIRLHMVINPENTAANGSSGGAARHASGSSGSQSGSSAEEDDASNTDANSLNGCYTSTVSSYEPLAKMNTPRCGVGLAALDGTLIALGGNDRGECLSSVEAYDTQSNQWSPLPPMSSPRGRFECAILNGQLFACGGSDGRRELNSVEYFDGTNWCAVPKMLLSKSSAGVGVLNNKLYVVGGYNGQTAEKTCEVYDPRTKTWSLIAPLNIGRSQAAVCSYRGLLYAIGGTDSWNSFNSAEVYNPQTNCWKFITPMSQSRRGAAATVFRGKLYVVGGSDGQRPLDSVEIYDPESFTWSSGPTLQTPRSNAGMAVLDGFLYISGGYGRNEFLADLEILEGEAESQWCSFKKSHRLSSAALSSTESDRSEHDH